MKPEEHGQRWRERRVAQSRRDVELETFPTTAGSRALLSHPLLSGGRGSSSQQAQCNLLFPVFETEAE